MMIIVRCVLAAARVIRYLQWLTACTQLLGIIVYVCMLRYIVMNCINSKVSPLLSFPVVVVVVVTMADDWL